MNIVFWNSSDLMGHNEDKIIQRFRPIKQNNHKIEKKKFGKDLTLSSKSRFFLWINNQNYDYTMIIFMWDTRNRRKLRKAETSCSFYHAHVYIHADSASVWLRTTDGAFTDQPTVGICCSCDVAWEKSTALLLGSWWAAWSCRRHVCPCRFWSGSTRCAAPECGRSSRGCWRTWGHTKSCWTCCKSPTTRSELPRRLTLKLADLPSLCSDPIGGFFCFLILI